jgi:hypothetical protein
VIALVFFHHAQNFDAGSGKRLLKDFSKKSKQTCQQHGQDTFIHQVSCRLQTLMTLRKARNASRGFSNLVEQRRKEELPVVVPEHCLNGGHLYSIVHAFVFPNNDLICLRSVLFKHSIISGGITTELVTTVLVAVSHLCAFLCLTKQPEPFPSPSFAPFAGCNSLSAFTAIVENQVPMRLAVLPLRKMSPLSGEPR